MELAISSIASLFSGGAAATGAAATGAAAAGAGAAAGGTGLLGALGSTAGILSGGLSVLSALRSYRASDERALEAEFAANQADAQKQDEITQGITRQTGIKRELLRVLGENDVNTAAAGIDLSYGYGTDLRAQATGEADYQLGMDQSTTNARTADLTARSANYRRIARGMRSTGRLNAALEGGQALLSTARRYG
ncbi:MAG: hypothetical protein AB1592_12840 [Pseudomonadota bacterium]